MIVILPRGIEIYGMICSIVLRSVSPPAEIGLVAGQMQPWPMQRSLC